MVSICLQCIIYARMITQQVITLPWHPSGCSKGWYDHYRLIPGGSGKPLGEPTWWRSVASRYLPQHFGLQVFFVLPVGHCSGTCWVAASASGCPSASSLYISLDSAFEQHLWSLWIVFVSRVLHASVAMVAVFQPNFCLLPHYLGKMLGFSHVEPEPKRVVYDRPDGPSSPFSSVCKNGPRTWSWRSKWTTRQLEKGHVIHTLKSGEQSTKLTNVSGEENLICESCPKKQRHSLQSTCPWLSSVFFLCSDLYSFSLGLRRPAWGAVLSMMGMRRFTCSWRTSANSWLSTCQPEEHLWIQVGSACYSWTLLLCTNM